MLVWLALANQHIIAKSELAERALRKAIQSEAVDPNAEFEGESLLMRTLSRRQTTSDTWVIPHDQSPLTATPEEEASLALLAKGADPWAPVVTAPLHPAARHEKLRAGLGMFHLTLKTNAWATLEKCLRHPHRPDWPTLVPSLLAGQKSEALPAVQAAVSAGLDPNWVSPEGIPLIFMCRDLDTVKWLAARGGGVNGMDRYNRNLVQARDHNQPRLSNDERAEWPALLTPGVAVTAASVLEAGLRGEVGHLKQLMPRTADQASWRWCPRGLSRPLTLLDTAALSTNDSLRHNLMKTKIQWPEASVALAQLALLGTRSYVLEQNDFTMATPAATPVEGQVRPTHLLETIDDLLAIRRTCPNDRLPMPQQNTFANIQDFAGWMVWADPEDRPRLLRRYAEWMSENPSRWSHPAFRFTAVQTSTKGEPSLSGWPTWAKELPAADQVPLLGAQVMIATKYMKQDTRAFNEAVVQVMDTLCQKMKDADYRWKDAPWSGLGEALKTSPLGPRWRAAVQAEAAMEAHPDRQVRARMRLRS